MSNTVFEIKVNYLLVITFLIFYVSPYSLLKNKSLLKTLNWHCLTPILILSSYQDKLIVIQSNRIPFITSVTSDAKK